ncbi:hypothetical protein LAG90_02175 [Marinilongibacter aquaticus]|uniref:hypothetical protein n=1 Tax=Marinilongibacter aquaticus TaxID=2975157 RepID=UPI0021BD399D|nr:hypothetical protein [Marinilongibacter aquaticus]UBM59463.1 hypothetical protein LAG90_02175 [Marinilongibacter aquaticus]
MEIAATDKEYKLEALGISAGFYVVFIVALVFFKIVYEAPEEEIAMGVDLNYGIDLTGYGDIQTTNKANDSKNAYDVKPADEASAEKNVSKPVPTPPQPKKASPKPTPTKASKAPAVITSEAEETPVVMKKTPTRTSTAKSSAPAPVETKPTPPAPPRSVDKGSVMKKKGSGSNSNGTTGTRDGIGGNNNGDGAPGAVGDQGDPRGTPDGKSLYGNPGKGGSGGASVAISGWNRRSFSLPKDDTSETGRIVFKVTVDDRGNVVSIVPTQSTVSPSVTNFYKTYIQRRLGNYLTPQGTPPPRSSGTITINITN